MKLVGVSGIGHYAKDLAQTAAFYEALGFAFRRREADQVTVQLNDFWLDFIAQDQEAKQEFLTEAQAQPKGAGQYVNIEVDDVDAFYHSLLDKGLRPSSEPRDWPWGNREFVIRDPDGYKLVFFQKKT